MENLFISTPMSVISREEYTGFRKQIISLIAFLKELFVETEIYYSGDTITSTDQFDNPIESYRHDIEALERCTMFALIYPEKSPTSALIELGYALKMNVPIFIITPTRKILPYMVGELDHSIGHSIILEYGEEDILTFMKKSSTELQGFFYKKHSHLS